MTGVLLTTMFIILMINIVRGPIFKKESRILPLVCCLLFLLAVFTSCATSHITDQQVTLNMGTIEPITDTSDCQFIVTAYFEVSHLSRMHFYAVKNTLHYGGDKYKIIGNTEDVVIGVIRVYGTNIVVYRCQD